MKNIVFIGNGILSLMTALRVVQKNMNVKVTVIGPNDRVGCASIAAPAMLNSYAELIRGSLETDIDKEKFKISRLASFKWKTIFDDLSEYDVTKAEISFGTYVLNNASTDSFDDDNFDAIIEYLEMFKEEYEFVNPKIIPGYKPTSRERAIRAIFMKNEGFVNSESVLNYLEDYLKNNGVEFINQKVKGLKKSGDKIVSVIMEDDSSLTADIFQLSPGANFSKILDNSNFDLNIQRVLYGSGVAIELKPKTKTLTNCVRTPNRGMACGVYSAPRTKNTVFIGASNLIADYGLEYPMVTSSESLLKSAMEQINSTYYNAGLVDIKLGWRPTSIDTYPLIGTASIENLIVATGTKRDGFHMSPVISEFLVALMFKESYEYSELFRYFKPDRSLIRNITREKAIQDIVDHQISAMYQHDFEAPKSNMINEYKELLKKEAIEVHDRVGAIDWGIPPELYGVYKGGYLS